jgi:hypothetical protein
MGRRSVFTRGCLVAVVLVTVLIVRQAPRPAEAMQPLPGGWSIIANRFTVFNAMEDSCYLVYCDDGDEPVLAIIAFRTSLGVRGSTTAWKLDDFHRVCSGGVKEGTTCPISPTTGHAHFPAVRTPTTAQIGAGVPVELLGTVQITIESDGSPYSALNDQLDRAVSAVRTELAAAAESVHLPDDFLIPGKLGERFGGIVDDVKKRIDLTVGDQIQEWLRATGNPAEVVDQQATAMVAVDYSLRDLVNKPLSALGGIAAYTLEPRRISLEHERDDYKGHVRYGIDEAVSYFHPSFFGSPVVARHSGQCLDIAGGSTAAGARLTQWPCSGALQQTFLYAEVGSQYATLRPFHSSQCLEISGERTEVGAAVGQWPCRGYWFDSAFNQQWVLRPVPGGYYEIVSRLTGFCLDVGGGSLKAGAAVGVWVCNGQANQHFRV